MVSPLLQTQKVSIPNCEAPSLIHFLLRIVHGVADVPVAEPKFMAIRATITGICPAWIA